ncbi:unnamed protein product [Darwinula stevensoni]|uniref:Innexin n=1 Tax=Darwinula stevensoni TaxID=69355 RepID=A0A7R8XIV1_9CRUS|nr:unnamed protein product [Darwinula stevensoni]CAG0894652.1 unnamed protein product [Darwinula stevensoni]
MLAAFAGIAHYAKFTVSPRADTFVFRLHYRFTVTILLAASIIVCSYQFVGKPIQCIYGGKIPQGVIDTYCWISSTFSLPQYWRGKVDRNVPYPGLGPVTPGDEITFHAYYQWVPFVLFLQAILFYIPHYMWRSWDNNKMKVLATGMKSLDLAMKVEERLKKEKTLTSYFLQHLHSHNAWAIKFVLCEFLTFVNVIGNIFFTDRFLGHQFTTYGLDAVSYLRDRPENRTDPLTEVFPKITKCTFHTFGPSGTIQKHDSLCVLALNIANEKIYVFLWFWFLILAILTGLQLLFRIGTIWSGNLRQYLLRRKAKTIPMRRVAAINEKCQFGDWFLLYQLGKNFKSFVYAELVDDLASVMDRGPSDPKSLELLPLNPSAPEPEYSLEKAPKDDKSY